VSLAVSHTARKQTACLRHVLDSILKFCARKSEFLVKYEQELPKILQAVPAVMSNRFSLFVRVRFSHIFKNGVNN
jgi:hypothetical protein